jgi:hypothetical protein
MDQREMAASTALSVAIVAAVAIFLREPDVARGHSSPTRSETILGPAAERPTLAGPSSIEPARPRVSESRPQPRAGSALPEPDSGLIPTLAQVEGPEDRPGRGRDFDRVAVVSRRRTVKPTQARSSFTTVEEGESLADVALRVYGDESAKERLWSANRDELPRRDSPLKVGTLLRTP